MRFLIISNWYRFSRYGSLFLVLLLWSQPATGASKPGFATHTLTYEGRVRKYLLYIPEPMPDRAETSPKEIPLVMVLHGGGGTHRGMIRLTRGRFSELADTRGFYVVYPNAAGKMWDFGEDDSMLVGVRFE